MPVHSELRRAALVLRLLTSVACTFIATGCVKTEQAVARDDRLIDRPRSGRLVLDEGAAGLEDRTFQLNGGTASESESRIMSARALRAAGESPQVIFLQRSGGRYFGGTVDDPARNVSRLIAQEGFSHIDFRPFKGSDAEWNQVVTDFRELYSRYNVTVTDVEPGSGPYIECVVSGNDGTAFGFGTNIIGYSPAGCRRLLPQTISFVFGRLISTRNTAETAAHEVGHACGLDHVYNCKDPMGYIRNDPNTGAFCGNRSFQDVDSLCGRWGPETCCNGGSRQNTVRVLLSTLGATSGSPTPAPTPGDPPPTVTIISPANGSSLPPNSTIEVKAEVKDDKPLAAVELVWDFTGRALECPGGNHSDWECARAGDVYTWRLNVGTGDRTFRVRARDSGGNVVVSESRAITLSSGDPCKRPTLTVEAPTPGSVVSPGQSFSIKVMAGAPSEVTVTAVEVLWVPGGDAPYSFDLKPIPGQPGAWGLDTAMSSNAKPGDRWLVFTAKASNGERATVGPVKLTVGR